MLVVFSKLPDHLQVWPAHGAGSACGKALGAVPQSTVGYERLFNPTLSLAGDEDAFVENILSGQPEPPLYFARMKRWNRDGVPLLSAVPSPEALSAAELGSRLDGVRVIDVRAWSAFREGHLPGAIWTKTGVNFLMTAGSYIEPNERIGLVAPPDIVAELVRSLVRIGLDAIEWVVTPEVLDEYSTSGGSMATSPEVDASEFRGLLSADGGAQVLDVRRAVEWDLGHLDPAINVAHTRLVERIDEVPTTGTVYVHCAGGIRSAMAVSELRRRGIDAVNVAGGWAAMQKAGCTEVECG